MQAAHHERREGIAIDFIIRAAIAHHVALRNNRQCYVALCATQIPDPYSAICQHACLAWQQL